MKARRQILAGLLAAGLITTGCSTPHLDRAKTAYFNSAVVEAADLLEESSPPKKDQVLFHMERGTIRQSARNFDGSNRDYLAAYDQLDDMAPIRAGQAGVSLIVNDTITAFRGKPFERTLLHAFTAKNHLALGHWEHAAVEARRLLLTLHPDVLGDYPDNAYARYLAGFALEMIGDFSNAALQYRNAKALAGSVIVDDRTGRISADPAGTNPAPVTAQHELVCFVLIGRSPSYLSRGPVTSQGLAAYAEFWADGVRLGRSHELANVVELAAATQKQDALKDTAKIVARIAAKETLAYQISRENQALGDLTRFILIGLLEQPDTRRWSTLPRSLHVARVPCPPDLREFEVHIKSAGDVTLRTFTVRRPIIRNGPVFVSHIRDHQPDDAGVAPPVPSADAAHTTANP